MSTKPTAAESTMLITTYLTEPPCYIYIDFSYVRSLSVDSSRQIFLLQYLNPEALRHHKNSFFSQCYRQHHSMEHESSMRGVVNSLSEHHFVPNINFA